jgi:hypothetical protein
MKIHTIVMLLVAFIYAGSIAIAQTKDIAKSDKKESCCQTQSKMSTDKSKDCCKDAKSTASKTDCMSKDGKKSTACSDAKKTDCCSKDGKKTESAGTTKDKDKK